MPFEFYLGLHHPAMLEKASVPTMMSERVLAPRKRLPRAAAPWILDSGSFTRLNLEGGWDAGDALPYVQHIRRYQDEIGNLAWCLPQDWMCEPFMIGRTGLSVAEHQRRTVENMMTLQSRAPALPWMPVLQGWSLGEYLECVDLYERAGISLVGRRVAVGSMCRRQGTAQARGIIVTLATLGLELHGLGFKVSALAECRTSLASSDSMAWSFDARYKRNQCGSTKHRTCANCLTYALAWRENMLARGHQLSLF